MFVVNENMWKSQTAPFWKFSCERVFSFLLLLKLFLSIEFLCKEVCFWKWERILVPDESGSYLQRALLTVVSLLGKSILVARHLQMWNVKSSTKCIFICFDAQNCSIYKLGEIHFLTYCIVQNACWCILLWKVTNWVGNKSWPSLILFQSLIRILWYSFCPRENLSPSPGSWTQ